MKPFTIQREGVVSVLGLLIIYGVLSGWPSLYLLGGSLLLGSLGYFLVEEQLPRSWWWHVLLLVGTLLYIFSQVIEPLTLSPVLTFLFYIGIGVAVSSLVLLLSVKSEEHAP